jgi:hypothetical protein
VEDVVVQLDFLWTTAKGGGRREEAYFASHKDDFDIAVIARIVFEEWLAERRATADVKWLWDR